MKRVVLVRSNQVNPDPPVEKIAGVLVESGYKVVVLGWDRENNYYLKEETLGGRDDVRVIRFGIKSQFGGGIKKTSKQLLLFQKRVYNWLKYNKNNYDIIHSFDFDTGFISTYISKKFKKKLVYHILDYYVESHGLKYTKIGYIVEKLEHYVINHADATIICTEKRKAQIAGSKPKQLVVIHNSPMMMSENIVPLKIQGNDKRCKIVYVGILAGTRFIEEIMELVKEDERLEFHIGGFGNLENKIIKQAKRCERIYFYGRLPYEKTLALENACDIMMAIYDPMVPNHQYAAPNKFYESLMLGKPIIMAKNTGFDEIIESNGIGISISYTLEGLKKGINDIILQRDNWDEMHKKSILLYKENYSWDKMKKRILKLYNNI